MFRVNPEHLCYEVEAPLVQVGIKALAGSDFGTALAVMEDMGLLRQGAGRDRSKRRWGLRADADDIVSAFQAVRILQPLLPA